ncbi:hypothetical protein KC614_04405 [candidate division WWE3 bacterium]|uniref:Uncharacterized protein n=1 Tax=candidate division WWE3 bacterium TaxID=2053526 RepID=A0A955RRC8_UNCKA|nr:hypothetical protein [candidate division WWE3 bacterium]
MSQTYHFSYFDDEAYNSWLDGHADASEKEISEALSSSTGDMIDTAAFSEKAQQDILALHQIETQDDLFTGNLPQVLADQLEIDLIDVEDETLQENIQHVVDTLGKIGSKSTMLGVAQEPVLGFMTNVEVAEVLGFIKEYVFENKQIEDLKTSFVQLLELANGQGSGVIVMSL